MKTFNANIICRIARKLTADDDQKKQLKEMERMIKDKKRILSSQARRKGVMENFGVKEINEINDKFFDLIYTGGYIYRQKASAMMKEFENWCWNYEI